MVRHNQHNADIVTEHLPGACGGHDARKGTRGVRASGMSGIEQSVMRDVSPRRATSPYGFMYVVARVRLGDSPLYVAQAVEAGFQATPPRQGCPVATER